MTPTLFLDEHLSPALCELAEKLQANFKLIALQRFQQGVLRGEPDEEVLKFCQKNEWVLVTADLNTIPALLKEWADRGESHQGIIFISNKSIRAHESVRIIKGLIQLVEEFNQTSKNWKDHVFYLR